MGCQHPGKLRTLSLFSIKVTQNWHGVIFIQIQSGNKRKFKSSTMDTESTWKVHGQTLIIDCRLWRKELGCFFLIWQVCIFQMQRWSFSSYCKVCTMSRTIQNPRISISCPTAHRVTAWKEQQWWKNCFCGSAGKSDTFHVCISSANKGKGLKHRCHCCH